MEPTVAMQAKEAVEAMEATDALEAMEAMMATGHEPVDLVNHAGHWLEPV